MWYYKAFVVISRKYIADSLCFIKALLCSDGNNNKCIFTTHTKQDEQYLKDKQLFAV
jgi:hypothetical protein